MLSPKIIAWIENAMNGTYSIHKIAGRSNSQIFKIINDSRVYALKIYPSHNLDKRDRLSVEFDSLDFLNRNGVTNTPKTFYRE